jgi:MFS family permease
LVSSILVGGFLGSMLGSIAAKALGRVRALMIATSLGAGGAALLAYLSSQFWLLIVTRSTLGLGVGWCMTVCPLYVHEVAPVEIRGRTGTLVGVSLVGSISLAQLVNYLFNTNDSETLEDAKWRIQFAMGGAPLLILFLFTFFIPESATWYAMHNVSAPVAAAKAAAANAERQRQQQQRLDEPLLGNGNGEIVDMEAPPSPVPEKNPHRIQGWRVLFRGRQGWRNLATCFILSASNQLTGINPVIFYLPKIFEEAEIGSVSLIIATAVGGWNLLSALIPLFSLERIGRRRFFVATLIVMSIGQILATLANVLHVDAISKNRSWISLPAVLLFIGAYQVG